MSLTQLKRIVLTKGKVPYYNRQHGNTLISTALDKEGLHTYIFIGDDISEHHLTPFNEVTQEEVDLLIEKLGKDTIEKMLKA